VKVASLSPPKSSPTERKPLGVLENVEGAKKLSKQRAAILFTQELLA
jgi:hypothetical protein